MLKNIAKCDVYASIFPFSLANNLPKIAIIFFSRPAKTSRLILPGGGEYGRQLSIPVDNLVY